MPTRKKTASPGVPPRRKRSPLTTAGTLLPLALGLGMNAAGPSKPAARAPGPTPHGHTPPCVQTLAQCPITGCAKPDDIDEQLLNRTKRNKLPATGSPKVLTLNDFTVLQNQADSTVGQRHPLAPSDRAKLTNILVSSGGTVSEGDYVQLDGFLVGKPHPNTGESVNCNFTQPANNDFHIPFADDAEKSPFAGIVVEMIPQDRIALWSIKNLQQVENARRMVRVTGQLFYDNEHEVNADEDESISGQPPRFSLWEVHPITTIQVCKQANTTCAVGDWEELDVFVKEPAASR